MFWGASTLGVVSAALGAVLVACALIFAGRLGGRRVTALLGGGLLLIGLSLSGVIRVVAEALAILSFNPVRWLGLGTGALGLLLLSVSGVLPGRRRRRRRESEASEAATKQGSTKQGSTKQVTSQRESESAGTDEDFGDVEEILRRRGIQ